MMQVKISEQGQHVVIAMALYLASAEDLETIDCFLERQEMRESPRNMQKPVTERRVSEHPAQSESQKALSWSVV